MLPAVNTLFNALLQNAQFRALDFSHLCVSQAGAWRQRRHGQAVAKVTGSTMIEGWGMSETCAIGTNNPVTNTEFTGLSACPAGHRHRHQGTMRATACPRASRARSASVAPT